MLCSVVGVPRDSLPPQVRYDESGRPLPGPAKVSAIASIPDATKDYFTLHDRVVFYPTRIALLGRGSSQYPRIENKRVANFCQTVAHKRNI